MLVCSRGTEEPRCPSVRLLSQAMTDQGPVKQKMGQEGKLVVWCQLASSLAGLVLGDWVLDDVGLTPHKLRDAEA